MLPPVTARLPPWTTKLWVRLSVAYSALSLVGMSTLMLITGTVFNYLNYFETFTPQNVDRVLGVELRPAALALRIDDLPDRDRQAIADRIHEALYNIQLPGGDDDIYQLTAVSVPAVSVVVTDARGGLFARSPAQAEEIDAGATAPDQAMAVEKAIESSAGVRLGTARIVFSAPYQWRMNIGGNLYWIISMWPVILVTSCSIGVICGIVAAQYIVGRLSRMNAVTEKWSRGDFGERIVLGSSDELALHAQRLNAMAAELQGLLKLRRVMAITEERNRMARDLHDTVKQKLFAMGLQQSTARLKLPAGEAALANLDEAITINREAQGDLVGIIQQLRPSDIGSVSFAEQLSRIVGNANRRLGLSVACEMGDIPEPDIEVANHLLRITEEALLNAVRHGKATRASIVCQRAGDSCSLAIADNGEGFDVDKTVPGFGFSSMRQRCQELPGGKINIRSSPGDGAVVDIRWRTDA